MRGRRRVALLGFGFVALVTSVYQVAVSDRVVGAVLHDQLARYVMAPCSIEGVDFSFADGLSVEGLTVLDPTAPLERVLVRVERARIDFRLGLFGHGFRISDIELDDAAFHLARLEDGSVPLLRMLRPQPPDREDDEAPPRPTVRVAGGTITYTDATLLAAGKSVVIADITGTLQAVGNGNAAVSLSKEHVLSLSGHCNLLGGVSLTGTLRGTGTESELVVELDEVRFERELFQALAPALSEPLREMDPTGAAALRVELRGSGREDLRMDARLRLLDAAVGYRIPNPIDDTDEFVPEYDTDGALRPVRITALEGALVFDGEKLLLDGLRGRVLDSSVRISATVTDLERPPAAWTLNSRVDLTDLHVSSALRDCIPFVAMRIVDAYGLDVRADVWAAAEGELGDPTITAGAAVHAGTVSYRGYTWRSLGNERRGFPWPVEVQRGSVRFDGRLVEIEADALRDGASVRIDGTVDHPPESPPVVEIAVTARDVDVGEGLRAAFEDRAEKAYDWLGPPRGKAAEVRVRVFNEPDVDGGDVQTDVFARFDGRATLQPSQFPVPVVPQRGILRILHPMIDGRRVEEVILEDVQATGDGFRVDHLSGLFRSGEGSDAEELLIRGRSEALERAVIGGLLASTSLEAGLKETVGFALPTGAAAFDLHLQGREGEREDRVRVEFLGTSVAGFAGVPLPVDDARGKLEYVAGRLTLDGLTGTVHGAAVSATGSLTGPDLDVPHFDVTAENLVLDDRLRADLGPWGDVASPFFEVVNPTHETRADLTIEARAGAADDLSVRIESRRLRGPLRPLGLDFAADDGAITYTGDEVTGWVTGKLGESVVSFRDLRLDTASGAFGGRAETRLLRFPEDLSGPLTEDAVVAISDVTGGRLLNTTALTLDWDPEGRRLTLAGPVSFGERQLDAGEDAGLDPEGPVEIERLTLGFVEGGATTVSARLQPKRMSLDLGLPVHNFNGHADIEGSISDAATVFEIGVRDGSLALLDRRLTDAACRVSFRDGRTVVEDLSAALYGGQLTGRVVAGGNEFEYRGNLSVKGANAQKALLAEREIGGLLDLNLEFRRRRGPDSVLEGEGKLALSEASLAEVPLIAVVVGPLETGQFRTADVDFRLEGDWIRIDRAELESSLVSISDGTGSVNLKDGRVDLTAKLEVGIGGPLDWLWVLVSETLFRVRIGGTVRNPQPRGEYFTLLSRFFGSDIDDRTEPVPVDGPLPFQDSPW